MSAIIHRRECKIQRTPRSLSTSIFLLGLGEVLDGDLPQFFQESVLALLEELLMLRIHQAGGQFLKRIDKSVMRFVAGNNRRTHHHGEAVIREDCGQVIEEVVVVISMTQRDRRGLLE